MGLKTFSISISDLSKDCYLRNDEKYYNFLTFSGWNIFKSNKINLVSLKNILSDDYTPFEYQDGKDYKGSIFRCYKVDERRADIALLDCLELDKPYSKYFLKVFHSLN